MVSKETRAIWKSFVGIEAITSTANIAVYWSVRR